MDTVADLVEPVQVQVRAKPQDYKAGQKIAEENGVTLTDFGPLKVSATVGHAGEPIYRTKLASSPDGLSWKCSCTDDPKVFCKHLVATALLVSKKVPRRKI